MRICKLNTSKALHSFCVSYVYSYDRCDEKITKGALKVGVVTEGSWGPSTQWHHMQCTVFQVATPEEVEGYNDLDDAVQVREMSSSLPHCLSFSLDKGLFCCPAEVLLLIN